MPAISPTRPTGAARWPWLVTAVAIVAGTSGLAVAVATAARQPKVVGSVGRSGDLSVALGRSQWVAHDSGEAPGMPMAGMPPEGFRRLHLEVELRNEGARGRSFGPDQFALVSSTNRWSLRSSSFVTGALAPGQAMGGDLYFDVPMKATDGPLRLAWQPPGRDVLFRLDGGLAGGSGDHGGEGRGK